MTVGRSKGLLAATLALVFGALYLSPVLWMVAASLRPNEKVHEDIGSLRSFVPTSPMTENYAEAVRRGDAITTLVNTVVVVLLITVGGILINTPCAYAFARMRFPGRNLLFLAVVSTIVIPLEVIVIPLFMTVRHAWPLTDVLGERPWTLLALSVPFMAKGFNIFLLRQHFLSVPAALEDAAYLDGLGRWGTFWRVALPNARNALITVALLDFVFHWNDFLWPLVICQAETTRTIQLGLGNFFTQPPIQWGAVMAYAVISTIPLAIAFAAGQRWIVRGMMGSGVRG